MMVVPTLPARPPLEDQTPLSSAPPPGSGRLSVVLCHQCQSLHYELLPCQGAGGAGVEVGVVHRDPPRRSLATNATTTTTTTGTNTTTTTNPVGGGKRRGEKGGSSQQQQQQQCCRYSITWDEFFGSSLELAPSLLNIYDSLAASDASTATSKDNHAHHHHPEQEESQQHLLHYPPLGPSQTFLQGHGRVTLGPGQGQGQGQGQPCVTLPSGLWVSDPDSQQRVFVRACRLGGGGGGGGLGFSAGLSGGGFLLPLVSGRPVSMMEVSAAGADKAETAVDKENVKKRPLSISSLSSVSSTSLPRLQHKRPNLSQDPEPEPEPEGGSSCCCSDLTSSDSNLTGDRVSFTSDRMSLTSDLVSMTSDPAVSASVTPSDSVSMTSMEDSGSRSVTAVGSGGGGGGGDRGEEEEEGGSSVDPPSPLEGFGDSRSLAVMRTSASGLSTTPSLRDTARLSASGSLSISPATARVCHTTAECRPSLSYTSASVDKLSLPNLHHGPSIPSSTDSDPARVEVEEQEEEEETAFHKQQQQPVVMMKPLQNTIRPVVISLPDSIRKAKPRCSSNNNNNSSSGGGGGSSSNNNNNSADSEKSGSGQVMSLEELACRPQTDHHPTSSSSKNNNNNSNNPRDKSSDASGGRITSPRYGGGGGGVSPGVVVAMSPTSLPFSPSTPRNSLGPLPTTTTTNNNNTTPTSPCTPSGGSPSSSFPPTPPSLQPFQVQAVVAQHSATSPLSPTAIARRRFLASHFDIPDLPDLPASSPPQEPELRGTTTTTTKTAASAAVATAAECKPCEGKESSAPSSPSALSTSSSSSLSLPVGRGGRDSSHHHHLTVPPSSLSFRSKGGDNSSLSSSPSGSPGSALHSPCGGGEGLFLPHPQSRGDHHHHHHHHHHHLNNYDDAVTVSLSASSSEGGGGGGRGGVPSAPPSASSSTSSPQKPGSSGGGGGSGGSHPSTPTSTPLPPDSPPTRGRSLHRKGVVGVSPAEGEGKGGVGSVKGGGGGGGGGGGYVTYVQRVVTEVVETERVYVSSLEAIIKGYLEPLRAMLVNSPTGQQDLSCLFCNITDIYAFGQVFLADLEQCALDPVKVAECFVKHNHGFVIYTDYCTNYPRAVEVLTRFMKDGDLNEVCRACQASLGHGLPLGAFLLRPVQRILKYHLLLQNILKNFDKGQAGRVTLEQALGHMTAMAQHINEMKRRHEHAVRIQEVQSLLEDYSGEDLTRLGELVLEGSFRVYGAKASRQVFLFERGILITKKKEGGMLTCKAFVPCCNLMLVEVISNEPLSFHIIPFDNPRAQHTLQARSMEQKRHWCQEIKRLILESYQGRIPDNVKNLVMELGRNHDNDYVGKDAHDSPWRHQHTAPEYLEKRRFRRKSGGKGPDLGPLLKLPKPGGKREEKGAGNKSKSPRMWRKSDSKLTRERSESLPRMLASANSLPGLGAPASLRSESFRRQTSTTSSTPTTPYMTPDDNNNKNKSFQSSDLSPTSPDLHDTSAEAIQRRTASFKRAMRMQPVFSQDLTSVMPKDVPMVDDTVKADDHPPCANSHRPSRPEHRYIHTGHRDRAKKGDQELNSYANTSSPSDGEASSDTDDERSKLEKQRKENKRKGSMYSSLPALHTLERKPAQKRRPGETKSGSKAKKDLSKSSDSLACGEAETDTTNSCATRQYRRRWEGSEDGLESKVPAMHDSYVRHSRENLLKKKGQGGVDSKLRPDRKSSSGARLTDWGSVDKLTHGSLSDLSHLQEDPWVKLGDSPSHTSSPRLQSTPVSVTSSPNTRSRSVINMQSNNWSPGTPTYQDVGRPRNFSDVTQMPQGPGKENLDWMVYVKRNLGDRDIRERANSLSRMSGRARASSGEGNTKTLRDSNTNMARSTSLCEDTLMRYSLDLPARKKLPYGTDIPASPKGGLADKGDAWMVPVTDRAEDRTVATVDDSQTPSGLSHLPSLSSQAPAFSPSRASLSPLTLSEHSVTELDVSQPAADSRTSSTTPNQIPSPPVPHSPRCRDSVEVVGSGFPPSSPHHVLSPCPPPADHQLPHSLQPHSLQSHSPQPLSPSAAALSAEGERMVAEMERYYEDHSPRTSVLTFKFPPSPQSSPSPQPAAADSVSLASINRLSGVSLASSSSNDGCLNQNQSNNNNNNLPPDFNPNRLSGVSSVSTSSYESQNSNSSDSLVGTLKNKLSMWTTKLGGRRSREEEAAMQQQQQLSASREGLSSPTLPPHASNNSQLQEVLREHSLGSPHIGSRMANTLPVGFEPLLSPQSAKDQDSCQLSGGKEGTPEAQTRFSFPSAVVVKPSSSSSKPVPEVFPVSVPVQAADSGISMYSEDSTGTRPHSGDKASTLPHNMKPTFTEDEGGKGSSHRRDSASSTDSGDSFYERRLSVAFESSAFSDQPGPGNPTQEEEPQSPGGRGRMGHRKSIREVVQFIEERFRPRQQVPVEVRRKEPSALIRQRLQSLRDNSSYRRRMSSRSVSEDRSRARERTPPPASPRRPRPETRSRSFNQFMHRVQSMPRPSTDTDRERERGREVAAARREQELAGRAAQGGDHQQQQGRESEERSEGEGSSSMSAMGSLDRLDQLSSDVDNLVIMRGWVRNLINKFQQIT
ncbi:uncharacterized protein LOC143296557 [Babylonia areolata]|uniref:uncharacterized protein LOC143296557 n=1 Tax=Babylonia areolata TaxID=304850 RepID=UPI003FD4A843